MHAPPLLVCLSTHSLFGTLSRWAPFVPTCAPQRRARVLTVAATALRPRVIGLRGRRWPRSPPRGFARRCQRIFVAGQDSPPEYNCSTVRYLRIANGRRGTSCRFELLWLDLRCPVPPRLTSRGLIAILPCGVAQCITQCTTFVPVATSWCASRAQFASACSPPCACPCTQTDGRLRDACALQQGC